MSRSPVLALLLLGLSGAISLGACRRAEDPPPLPYGAPPPGQWQQPAPQGGGGWPPPAGAPQPGPGPGRTSGTAAMGLPCSGDFDLQCPFSHCMGGRCGGCASASDCKPGSSCSWTPLGNACILAGFPSVFPAPGPAPQPAPGPAPAPSFGGGGDARQQCVDRTNQYRAGLGRAPLARAQPKEPCDDQEAQSDAATGQIHGAFGRCGEFAQNECPGWPGAPEAVVGPCLQKMFEEGPGVPYEAHGHYINMMSTSYTTVSCGFYTKPDGSLWMVQNFW